MASEKPDKRKERDPAVPSPFLGRLGLWSSHPNALRRQRVRLFLLGLLPLFIFAGVAAFALVEWETWRSLLVRLGDWGLGLAIALCASLGALLTMGMLNMVARTLGSRKTALGGRDELKFPLWFLVVASFFWILPWALLQFRENLFDPKYFGRIQFAFNILCLLPFVGILAWVAFARVRPKDGRHPRFLLLLGGLLLALGVLSLFTDVRAALLARFPGSTFLAGIQGWMAKVLLFATLFPLGAVCLLLWHLIWCEARPKKKKKKKDKDGEPDEEPSDEEKPDELPEIAKYLMSPGVLPTGIRLEGPIARKTVENPSPLAWSGAGLGSLMLLMDGRRPTVEQFQFFTQFRICYADALGDFMKSDNAAASFEKADMILQGQEGSGRTEITIAAALYAAVVRGQSVLFLVPDGKTTKRLADQFAARLDRLYLGCYFNVGHLVRADVPLWLDPSSGVSPPDILVATPQEVEDAFFTLGSSLSAERREKLRSLIVEYGVIFVDDLLRMPICNRTHVAFLLDKFRLLLSSASVVPQFVVVTPQLFDPDGVERLGERLFGLGQFNRRENVFSLRPRDPGEDPSPPAPGENPRDRPRRKNAGYLFGTVRVSGDLGLDNASQKLVKLVLERNCSALLYRKGIGKQEEARLEATFKTESKNKAFRVISRLDDLDAEASASDVVFYLSLTCGNADAALKLNFPDGQDPVFLRIAAEGERDEVDGSVFALLSDETALPLRSAHLRSLLPFTPRLVPVPSRVWSHFGVSPVHPGVREASHLPDEAGRVAVRWLYDELVGDEGYSKDVIWPYLVLTPGTAIGSQGNGLLYDELPHTRECVWLRKDESGETDEELLLARPADAESGALRQIAVWKTSRGDRLGETDLAHADELVLSRDGDEYAVFEIHGAQEAEQKRYVFSVEAQFRHGTDADYLIPVRTLEWNVPYGGLLVPDIKEYESLAAFPLERTAHRTFRVSGSIRGLINLLGRELRKPRRNFAYDAYLSCFVLLPEIDFDASESEDESGAERLVRDCMNGTWRTDSSSGFSPALTHALTAALRSCLDGWSFFATAPAFYIDGREGSVGRVVLWLVEPTNSGKSAYPLLVRLMEHNDVFRKDLFKSALQILRDRTTLESLRMTSRMAFAGERLDPDDVAQATRILELLLSQAERDADAAERAERKRTRPPEPPPERRPPSRYTDEEREFDSAVVSGLLEFEEVIDVTKFARDYGWSERRIADLFMDVLWNNPQIFFVAKRGKYQWWTDADGRIVRFVIRDILYGFDKSEKDARQAELDEAVAQALAKIDGVSDPVERAAVLHDHIVEVCEYDMDAYEEDDLTPTARTAYSVLVRKRAVCEGYTMAYRYLLWKAGIESEEVLSDAMNHCWNYVFIGGNWYHVDVTWDDPVLRGAKPASRSVSRENFLMSDVRSRATKHHGWTVRGLPPATDTTYDNRNWEA